MKKLLLFSLALAGFSAQAQFWTSKATTFNAASRGVDDICIVSPTVIWAKAYDGSGGGDDYVRQYTKSTDGGETWTSGAIAGINLNTTSAIADIAAISDQVAWIASWQGGTGVQGIWKTTNGGSSWSRQGTAAFNSAGSFTNLVHFWDANVGVCQGDPADGYFEIYTTTNGGTNWTRVPQANIPAPLTGEYGYVHNFDVVGNTMWFGTNLGRIYKSTNQGLNWTVSQSPISDFAGAAVNGSYSFTDANNGLLNSNTGGLWNTTDGGVTWNPVTYSGMMGNNSLDYVPGTAIVVTTQDGGGTAYSLDNGLSWNDSGMTEQVTVLSFLSNTVGFGGGFTDIITPASVGGIYKYTGNVLATAQFGANKLTVHPNPSNGIYNLTGAPIQSVLVSDLLGKQVFKGEFGMTDNNTIDLTSLNSGVYLMTITGEGSAQKTVKIVKE